MAFLKKLRLMLLVAALAAALFSCAFPFQTTEDVELSDISGRLRYTFISRQAFMGGSVLYNPDQPSSGQLVNGVNVAVRLGKVTADYHGDIPVFSDIEEEARYGYITIDSIEKEHIAFSYTEYSADGKIPRASAFALRLNEELDINGDGVTDVTYTRPLRKRPGFEEAVYLTFISSQEELRTAMFAVLPEQYSRGVYPSGLMGINPDDKWLVSKYEGSTSARAAVRGVSKGDYVLDAQRGEYLRFVGSGTHYRSARSVDDSDLELVQTDEETTFYFSEAEFQGAYSAKTLFNALPVSITSRFAVGQENTESDFIRYLNEVLEYTDLVAAVIVEMEPETPQAELDSFLAQATSMTQDELVKLNRLSLEKLYEENCPSTNATGAAITEILPLASVIIADPEAEPEEEPDLHARGVMRATDYDDYKSKKAAIDEKFSQYFKLAEIRKYLPNWAQYLVDPLYKWNPTIASIGTGNVLLKDNSDEYGVAITSEVTLNNPLNIGHTVKLQPGVKGHFNITWGNVHIDAAIAIYATADTGLTLSKSFYNVAYSGEAEFFKTDPKPVPAIVNKAIQYTIDKVNIPLSLVTSAPIVIGPIYFTIGVNGYMDFPVDVYIAGDIVGTLYAGCTALYGAGFNFDLNYGIRTKRVKILWWYVSIPLPYVDPRFSGTVIDDLVYYAGIIGNIRGGELFQLQNARIGFITRPSLSFGPVLTLCDLLSVGVSAGPAFEVGFELGILPYNGQLSKKHVYGDFILGAGLDLNLNYKVLYTIPKFFDGLSGRMPLKRFGVDEKRYRVFPK